MTCPFCKLKKIQDAILNENLRNEISIYNIY